MGSYRPLECPQVFENGIFNTQRLFAMFHNGNGFHPEITTKRWNDILTVANVVVDLTDEPVRTPIFKMISSVPPTQSVFAEAFAKAN